MEKLFPPLLRHDRAVAAQQAEADSVRVCVPRGLWAPAAPVEAAVGLRPRCVRSRFPQGPSGSALPCGEIPPGPASAQGLVPFPSVAR